MGREVRRVPPDWKHPKGRCLYDGTTLADALKRWDEGNAKWAEGLVENHLGREIGAAGWSPIRDYAEYAEYKTFEEWDGPRPDPEDYMPDWPPEVATHYQMYETTTEGSPISPVFATPEELAHWLADTGASVFANQTASYEAWLYICNGGYAPSLVMTNGAMESGVEGAKRLREPTKE